MFSRIHLYLSGAILIISDGIADLGMLVDVLVVVIPRFMLRNAPVKSVCGGLENFSAVMSPMAVNGSI